MIVSPANFKKTWGYKYVCFSDGQVLFTEAGNINCSHRQLVEGQPDKKAVSAGTIMIRRKLWTIFEGGSESAKLPRLPKDEDQIEKVLEPYGFVHVQDLPKSL